MQNDGLEDLGKHIVGDSKWQEISQKLFYYGRDLEQERTADFDPSEVPEPDIPDSADADLSHVDPSDTAEEEVGEEKNETLENFIHSLPYWFINRAFGAPGLGFGEDLTGAANLDAFDVNQRLNSLIFLEAIRQQYAQVPPALQNSLNHVQNSPLFSPDVFEVAKVAKNSFISADAKYGDALQLGLRGLSTDYDEPLDLTQKNGATETDNLRKTRKFVSKDVQRNDDDSLSARSLNTTADTPKTQNKVSPRQNQRAGKGYTSEELEAALRDIQSGKLGTRRAAVIYGIPRSTLRNKVYKLGKDRNRPYFRQKNSVGVNSTEDIDEASNALVSSRININARNHGVCSMDIGDQHNFATTNKHNMMTNLGLPHSSFSSQTQRGGVLPFSSHRLQEPGFSEDEVGKSEEEISHEKKVLKEWLTTKLQSRQAFVEQHCKTRSPCDRFSSSNSTNIGNNRTLADEEPLSDSSDNSDVSRRKEVILKIPARFQQKGVQLNNKSSLSRVISRKKLKRRTPKDQESNHSSPYSLPLMTVLGTETCSTSTSAPGRSKVESLREWKNPGMSGNDSMDDAESDTKSLPLSTGKREKHNSWTSSMCGRKELQASASSSSNMMEQTADANGKKSRPKRGKYRNYDRDALVRAVRAVQNGEMSVHRAGSFYGVPHSTLEYKVKERHLLRRPKRKETESPKLSHKSSPESSMSGSDHHQQPSRILGAETNNNNNNNTSLPLTPDLRESLSRYLNIGQSGENHSADRSSSPVGRLMSKNQEESLYSRENRIDNHSLGLGRRGIISPFFNLDDLMIRQNLETNSLLDLTKK